MKISTILLLLMLTGDSIMVVRAQVQLFNDEFDNSLTVDNWININEEEGWNITQLESYNINDSSAGQFFIKPITESWFGEYRGAYLFKYISGDFVLTTEVTATGRDHMSLPSSTYSLGGIMIRKPLYYPNQDPSHWTAGQQNYIFMSLGQATGPGNDFEIKNTCNSNSVLDIVGIPVNTAKIRMVRKGNEIVVLSQFGNNPWVIRNRYDRNDCSGDVANALFPDTVQIGFVVYTDWPKVNSYTPAFQRSNTLHPDSLGGADPTPGVAFNPDIIANFDYIRFDTVPQGIYNLELTGGSQASDQQILDLVGYATQAFCPLHFEIVDPIRGQYLPIQAAQQITAENVISNQANVTYGAAEQITLIPGFEVEVNSVFEVNLNACSQ